MSEYAAAPGFHEGELLVQCRAGVRHQAQRLAGMLDPADLSGGAAAFLAQRTFAVITARDTEGVLWTSPLSGPAGFLDATGPQELQVAALPRPGDPLANLTAQPEIGMIAIDFDRRRRLRVNGRLSAAGPGGLSVEVHQAFGNCPQHIQRRTLPAPDGTPVSPTLPSTTADHLSTDDVALIRAADTFFLGTTHPTRGVDSSHRGGPAGFVRVDDDRTLWWPDFPGNNMFTSLGNIAVDPAAALLFIDFSTGRVLHLSGRAVLEQVEPGSPGDDAGTGRRIRFHLDRSVAEGGDRALADPLP